MKLKTLTTHSKEQYMKIKKRVLCPEQICRRLKLDKKTVRKWICQEFIKPQRPGRTSKLDSFKEEIKSWSEHDDYTAQHTTLDLRKIFQTIYKKMRRRRAREP